jgi:hypothetical protein
MKLHDEAYYAETFVIYEQGYWTVYIEVIFDDVIQRHKVGTYYSEAKAKIAAHYMKESANVQWNNLPTGM